MISTYDDILAIKAILDIDPYLDKLGFTPENVVIGSVSDEEITSNTIGMYIYGGYPNGKVEGISANPSYRVLVVAEKKKRISIIRGAEQVVALLADKEIVNNHVLNLMYPPMEMSTPADIMGYQVEFSVRTPYFTPIKRV